MQSPQNKFDLKKLEQLILEIDSQIERESSKKRTFHTAFYGLKKLTPVDAPNKKQRFRS
jgi:hypothetical protein